MNQSAGNYIKHADSDKTDFVFYTFIPRPLEEGNFFQIDDELSDLLIDAYHALGVLDGSVKYAPNKASFADLSLFMECCYSRLIDYQTPLLYNALKGEDTDYITNIASAYRYSDGKAISMPVLSSVFEIALSDADRGEKVSFRKKQTFMLRAVTNLKVYNPTSPEGILPAMKDIMAYLRKIDFPEVLTKAALAHYQFETIHPFEYYNGIVGRVLIFMILRATGLKAPCFMSLSEFLYNNKNEYFDIISSTQRSGSHIRWIKFMIRGIIEAANQAVIRLDKYEKLIEHSEAIILSGKILTKNNVKVYNCFKRRLVSQIKPIAEELSVSFNTVSKSIDLLVNEGILRAEKDQSRHRYFVYDTAVDVFM